MEEVEFCVLDEEKDIIEYEKKQYRSYKKDKDGFIFKNFEILENDRLKPIYKYEDIVYYAAKLNNEILAGMTIHINSKNKFYCEMMGFETKIIKDKKTGEGLTIFIDDEIFEDPFEIVQVTKKLGLFAENDVFNKRDFHKMYGTTNKKFKNFHKSIFHWKVLETKLVINEYRCLLFKEKN